MNKTILKVIVGSQAHGLANAKSDTDYRGVFVVPTSEILALGTKTTTTSWIEGTEDDTSWEVGHFLNLATHCNPTILETFLAPTFESSPWGEKIRAIFPHVWNSVDVKNAFIGYGLNQRKKFFDNKDNRAPKYAVAYLRVLYQAWELLSTGTFSVNLTDTAIFETLRAYKAGNYTPGDVIDKCWYWETQVLDAFKKNPDKQTNKTPINELLLEIRKDFWNA